MLRASLNGRWVALGGFILVMASCISLYQWPEAWLWSLFPSIVFWGFTAVLKKSSHVRLFNNWALLIFVLTAAVGSWVAYNESAAWNKFCLIVAAVLFYFAIVGQPLENLNILMGFWFIVGVGIGAYFLLTFNFGEQTVKFQLLHQIGLYWMRIRPVSINLPSIHPNDVAGISIITSAYGLFFLRDGWGNKRAGHILKLAVLAGLGIVILAVLVCSSRGAFLAVSGALVFWALWQTLSRWQSPLREKLVAFYPHIVVISLLLFGVGIFILPFGFSGSLFSVGGNVTVSRMELVRSGLWILRDFPFTGGGLDSFPGLFSQYVLVIPYYSILNSHNMFLDVMIEQGILGGISFLCIYLMSVWQLMVALRENRSTPMGILYLAATISLFTAILHGMVDDYIYGGRGTILALIPAAMAVLISKIGRNENMRRVSEQPWNQKSLWFRRGSSPPWLRPLLLGGVVVVLMVFTWNNILAQWYANIGSVKMAKIDLMNYPANHWYDGDQTDKWLSAENDFRQALTYQPNNRTANHRLGLIRLMNRDFASASDYFLHAYEQDSINRGVVKNLGYSYVWLGETDKAQSLLARVPEAKYEMSVYVWWWGTQDRNDLAENADKMASQLEVIASPQ